MRERLEKRSVKRMGLDVTFLGFGALEIGRDWGIGGAEARKRPDVRTAEEVLHRVLDLGINLVDTASAYHRSEERIGQALESRRSEFILASKCGEHNREPDTYYDFSYQAVKRSIDDSLQKLRTDVIDVMQIHFGPEPERVLQDGETLAAMKEAQREGKIRFLGASADGEVARVCIESDDFDMVQMPYHILDRTNEENIRRAGEKGMGVFIRGGLNQGILTKKVLSHWDQDFPDKDKVKTLLDWVGGDGDMLTALALQFLKQNPYISSVLVGTKNIDRLQKNIALLHEPLSEDLVKKATDLCR